LQAAAFGRALRHLRAEREEARLLRRGGRGEAEQRGGESETEKPCHA
jgi:hypothetical protein